MTSSQGSFHTAGRKYQSWKSTKMALPVEQYDDILLGILQKEGKIGPFLEAIFSFLYRRTDFYRILHGPHDKMGFPEGTAEKLVLQGFKKYQRYATEDEEKRRKQIQENLNTREPCKKYLGYALIIAPYLSPTVRVNREREQTKTKQYLESAKPVERFPKATQVSSLVSPTQTYNIFRNKIILAVPEVATIVEIDSDGNEPTDRGKDKEDEKPNAIETNPNLKYEPSTQCQRKVKDRRTASEAYNGAIHDNYCWSQSLNDIDVHVKVPDYVVKAKFVRVTVGNSNLKVDIQCDSGQWKTLLDGELLWRINKEQSMWTLVPGEHVYVNFEKLEERWWDALLVNEPKIDMQAIEPVKDMNDLPEDEKAKIDELLFNERQKLLNKPTTEQMKIHNILKEAWDIEGSPFKGQPFDPSIVNIYGTTDGLCGLNQPSS